MRRRRFLAALALAPTAAAGCKTKEPAAPAASPPPPAAAPPEADGCQIARRDAASARVLSPAEWDALAAACERILPRDEDPGAGDAGVINYIDAQLTTPPVSSFRALLQAGAGELDRLAAARGGRRFSALAGDAQDQVLTAIQARMMGRHAGGRFFQVLLVLTLEGFFSDPIYGGNRGEVGWKMIGLSPRRPRALCAYRGPK